MAISLTCPGCAKKYKVEDQHAGKKISCRNCDTVLTIPHPDSAPQPKSPQKPQASAKSLPQAKPKASKPAVADPFDDWDAIDESVPASGPRAARAKSKQSSKPAKKPPEEEIFDAEEVVEEATEVDEFFGVEGDAPPPPPRTARTAPKLKSSRSTDDAPKKKARPRRESSGGGANPLVYSVSGLIGGLIGAAIWGGIVIATDHEIGWIAWGIGALVGFAVRVASSEHHDGSMPGIVAAAISVVSICAGKFFAAAALVDNAIKEVPALAGAPRDVIRMELFKSMFGGLDILFFFLAIATAWRVGSGQTEDE